MKSIVNCRVLLAGLLTLNGMVPSAGAKTIMVDSLDAAAFLRPASHFAFREQGAGLTHTRVSVGAAGSLSGLYDEGRKALHGLHAAPVLREAKSMMAPVQQSDFRAMLLVGAVLVAQQLRRKHRSLRQSLIAG